MPAEIFFLVDVRLIGTPGNVLLVGEWEGLPCYAADIDNLPENISGELMSLRSLFNVASAMQILDRTRYHASGLEQEPPLLRQVRHPHCHKNRGVFNGVSIVRPCGVSEEFHRLSWC